MNYTPPKLTELVLTRNIPASPEAIYDVWLDPKSPGGPWFGAKRVILDPEVDGLFFHAVEHEGRTWAHYGRFTVLERGARIEHTWMSEATRGVESVVTVTLTPKDGGTLVTLRHTGVPDDEMGRSHADGWGFILGAVAERVSRKN